MTILPEPFNQTQDAFISGEADLDIDDIFAKKLSEVIDDLNRYNPEMLEMDMNSYQPSLFEPGYIYRDVPAGVILIDPAGNIAGGYLSSDLVLGENHKGKGLGIELIIERCLRDGENPVHNLDTASYSRKGLRAFEAAWEYAQSHPEEIRQRLKRWEKTSSLGA